LLIPQGSRLLELDEIRSRVSGFDPKSLVYPWKHDDPDIDELSACALNLVNRLQKQGKSRSEIFAALWSLVDSGPPPPYPAKDPIPHLNEPWYCCAEPAAHV